MSDEPKPLTVHALEAELDKLRPQYYDLQTKYFESCEKRDNIILHITKL